MLVALVGAEFEENLAVRYLWGALQHAGHSVELLVFNSPADVERVAQRLADLNPDIAGLSMVFTYRAREFAEVATRSRALGFGGHIVAGGHFAAFHHRELLTEVTCIDSVGVGEGESILCELAERLPDLSQVKGLVWRKADSIVVNPPAVNPLDLDQLPYPPRKRPLDDYLGVPITNILSSRGCSYACCFCSISAWHRMCGGPRHRLRSPTAIADEMATLYRQGARIFNFHDDNFLLRSRSESLERLQAIEAALLPHNLGRIAFAIKARPDGLDPAILAQLKRMGLFRVFLGIEAGTADSLLHLGRGQTVADNLHALALLRGADIHTCFNLLMFNPASTLDDVAGNARFLRSHPYMPMNFCRTEAYAGTPLMDQLRSQDRLQGDFWGFDYTIADPQAQAAFEAIYPAFESRNYGDDALHHLTMQVDYEYQLLQHFFGPDEPLRARVKDFITAVNQNTCDHLDRTIEAVRSGAAGHAFCAELKQSVQADNVRLVAQGNAIIADIQRAARSARRRHSGWVRTAATASIVAASVSIVGAGCRDKTYPTETIAVPTMPVPPTLPSASSSVSPDASSLPDADTGWVDGDPESIRAIVGRDVVAKVASRIPPNTDLDMEVFVDSQGKVERADVLNQELPENVKKSIDQAAKNLRLQSAIPGRIRYRISYTADEIRRAGVTVNTHRSEMIAPRNNPTHPNERAPRKPRSK